MDAHQKGNAALLILIGIFIVLTLGGISLYLWPSKTPVYPDRESQTIISSPSAISAPNNQNSLNPLPYAEDKGTISIKKTDSTLEVLDKGREAYLFSDQSNLAYIHDVNTQDEWPGATYSDLLIYDFKTGLKNKFLENQPNLSMDWSPHEKYVMIHGVIYEYPSGKDIGAVDVSYNAINAFIIWLDDDNFIQEEYIKHALFERCNESGEVVQISKISLPSMNKEILIPPNIAYDVDIKSVEGDKLTYTLIPSSNVSNGSCTDPKGDTETKQLIIK